MPHVGDGCKWKGVLEKHLCFITMLTVLIISNDFTVLCSVKELFFFNAVKASCNWIRVFVSKYEDFWQLNPGPLCEPALCSAEGGRPAVF